MCRLLFPGEREEVSRVTSPDSAFDAVVIWGYGGGAAGWSQLYVYVTPVGAEPTGEPIIRTYDSVPAIHWIDGRHVRLVPYNPVEDVNRVWISPEDGTDTVRISLQPWNSGQDSLAP